MPCSNMLTFYTSLWKLTPASGVEVSAEAASRTAAQQDHVVHLHLLGGGGGGGNHVCFFGTCVLGLALVGRTEGSC